MATKEKETIWRVQEDDVNCVIEEHFPQLSEEERIQIIEKMKRKFEIPSWDIYVRNYIEDELATKE